MVDLEREFFFLAHNLDIFLFHQLGILVLSNFFQLLLKFGEHLDETSFFLTQQVAFFDEFGVFGLDLIEHLVFVLFDSFIDDCQSVQFLWEEISLFDQFFMFRRLLVFLQNVVHFHVVRLILLEIILVNLKLSKNLSKHIPPLFKSNLFHNLHDVVLEILDLAFQSRSLKIFLLNFLLKFHYVVISLANALFQPFVGSSLIQQFFVHSSDMVLK